VKRTSEPTPEADGSVASGVGVAVVIGAGLIGGFWQAAPEAALLTLWGGATVAVWWSVSRTANPAPPPEEDPSPEKKPQFTVVDDPSNPARARVVWADERTTR